jgi:hypothetical protein
MAEGVGDTAAERLPARREGRPLPIIGVGVGRHLGDVTTITIRSASYRRMLLNDSRKQKVC